jgi:signal transduction histidine kinase/CheY-like chemotaxis protein
MGKLHALRTDHKIILLSAGVGLLFPLLSILMVVFQLDIAFSLGAIAEAHAANPLLFVIDSAPLVLGLMGSYIGHRQLKLEAVPGEMQQVIAEQTHTLRSKNEALEAEVYQHRLTQLQLEAASKNAQSEAASKTEFLATMSHEIRTPLNALIGTASLLGETHLNPEQQEYIHTIRVSGEIMLGVINNILDFSKLDSEAFELEALDFRLREPFEDALEILYPKGIEKGVEVYARFQDNIPEVISGDMARLRQVLINLLSNAVKFTERGEVAVHVSLDGIIENEATIRVEVRDTGIGISPSGIRNIFESYRQAEGHTTRRYGGTGLGLAISKKLVHQMGGEIWVESLVGQGTSFFFTFKMPVGELVPASEQYNILRGKRALLIDDFMPNLHLLTEECRRMGMQSVGALHPEAALKHLSVGSFDVVITDLRMPVMNGVELARQIRRLYPEMPIVLVSALGFKVSQQDQGLFQSIVMRPVRASQLGAALQKLFKPVSAKTIRSASPRVESYSDLPGNGLSILIAEDNLINQRVASRMFEKLGYKAELVSNGREAVEAARKKEYHLIFMDMQMPEMDGIEATRIILREAEDFAPRIIAMTANASSEDRQRCLNAGMCDFLTKPVQLDALRDVLAKWSVQTKKALSGIA